jgi:hypothetical protein
MDDQVQVVDTGKRTLSIHSIETIYFCTKLESVQKQGDLIVVTDHKYLLRIGSKRASYQPTAVQT